MIIITNTLTLTKRQEEVIYRMAVQWFEKNYTAHYSHFAFLGTKLHPTWLAFYEIWTEDEEGFLLSVEVNGAKKPLKRTISVTSIDEDFIIRVL